MISVHIGGNTIILFAEALKKIHYEIRAFSKINFYANDCKKPNHSVTGKHIHFGMQQHTVCIYTQYAMEAVYIPQIKTYYSV